MSSALHFWRKFSLNKSLSTFCVLYINLVNMDASAEEIKVPADEAGGSRPLHARPLNGDDLGRGLRIDVRRTGNRVSITEAIQIGGDSDREPPFQQTVTGILVPRSGARQRAMELVVAPLASLPNPTRQLVKDIRDRLPDPKSVAKNDYDFVREMKKYYEHNIKPRKADIQNGREVRGSKRKRPITRVQAATFQTFKTFLFERETVPAGASQEEKDEIISRDEFRTKVLKYLVMRTRELRRFTHENPLVQLMTSESRKRRVRKAQWTKRKKEYERLSDGERKENPNQYYEYKTFDEADKGSRARRQSEEMIRLAHDLIETEGDEATKRKRRRGPPATPSSTPHVTPVTSAIPDVADFQSPSITPNDADVQNFAPDNGDGLDQKYSEDAEIFHDGADASDSDVDQPAIDASSSLRPVEMDISEADEADEAEAMPMEAFSPPPDISGLWSFSADISFYIPPSERKRDGAWNGKEALRPIATSYNDPHVVVINKPYPSIPVQESLLFAGRTITYILDRARDKLTLPKRRILLTVPKLGRPTYQLADEETKGLLDKFTRENESDTGNAVRLLHNCTAIMDSSPRSMHIEMDNESGDDRKIIIITSKDRAVFRSVKDRWRIGRPDEVKSTAFHMTGHSYEQRARAAVLASQMAREISRIVRDLQMTATKDAPAVPVAHFGDVYRVNHYPGLDSRHRDAEWLFCRTYDVRPEDLKHTLVLDKDAATLASYIHQVSSTEFVEPQTDKVASHDTRVAQGIHKRRDVLFAFIRVYKVCFWATMHKSSELNIVTDLIPLIMGITSLWQIFESHALIGGFCERVMMPLVMLLESPYFLSPVKWKEHFPVLKDALAIGSRAAFEYEDPFDPDAIDRMFCSHPRQSKAKFDDLSDDILDIFKEANGQVKMFPLLKKTE